MRKPFALSLLSLCALASVLGADAPAAKPIFNGKNLDGWKGMDGIWRVEDGAIVGETTQPNQVPFNTFLVWQDGEVDDFELEFDYKLEGGNSGMQIRSHSLDGSKPEDYRIGGYQSDIEDGVTYTGIVYEEGGRGIVCERGQKTEIGTDHKPKLVEKLGDRAELQKSIKLADWNHYKIVAQGNHITNTINGVLMADMTDNDPEKRAMSGKLAIQVHRFPKPMKVSMKNIMLKRLPLGGGVKKVALLAGKPSHGPGEHEHRAGCLLLADQLNKHMAGKVLATVYTGGWPTDPTALDNVDAVVSFTDGGGGHPLNYHLKELDAAAKRGAGVGCLHYGVETVTGEPGQKFLEWIGGFFEINWSVNPHWDADYTTIPQHEVTRGVKPFKTNDEWYYHMRFRPGMEGVTPILSAVPPTSTLSRADGTHSGNPAVREAVAKGEPQHMMWVATRPDGGRGFGCTGSHFHKNWANADYRKLILNTVCWIAKAEVPADGVPAPELSEDYLKANLDPKGKK